jgi:hypothetical protein
MQLDLLGEHEPGLFILELKVDKPQNATRSRRCLRTTTTSTRCSLYLAART